MEKDKKVTALYCRLSKDDGSNSESLSIRTHSFLSCRQAGKNECFLYIRVIPVPLFPLRLRGIPKGSGRSGA